MELIEALESRADSLVDEAVELLEHRLVPPYKHVEPEVLQQRLGKSMTTLITALKKRNPLPVIEHGKRVAHARFNAGYQLEEIQTAFNALEETIWQFLVDEVDSDHLAEGLVMVAHLIGAIKDQLGRTYVELASHHHAPSINTSRLFAGPQGG
ncbi:MAG: hypothetical protein CSA84_06870 [Actinomycetales bacterium]|nr:MAG: hypothetical protein CSA84_06870 [Actinomycetales bacterium]